MAARSRRFLTLAFILSATLTLQGDPSIEFLERHYPEGTPRPDIMHTDFPCYPAVQESGSFRPIVGVDVDRAYYYVRGTKRYVRPDQVVTFLPVSHFGPGFVNLDIALAKPAEVAAMDFDPVMPNTQWVRLPRAPMGFSRPLELDIDFRTDRFLRGGFLALVLYDDALNRRIFWKQIGNMRSGEERQIKWVTDPIPTDKSMPHNFILVFDRLGELRTSRRVEIGETLAALELRWQLDFRELYVRENPSVHALPIPLYHGTFLLPHDISDYPSGKTYRVRVTIDPYGYVRRPRLGEEDPDSLGEAFLYAIRTWKFFPQLDGGDPVETDVYVPMIFQRKN